ncbi:hypothetical protein GUITHDRAFT_134529 [Guillardia theta CCMP2712]|uniref:Phosphatidic acid phosphatase type 2/haloperoxidase domain-containing protein n=1 Tax=Guillardia theta (strain CCMP2712) TaxID=905079 RepID=L1JU71_GUITC|nr:hypothetical protein GUITHDRAFT_134529 [Guillardia theta CCMP2712]EKX51638.1 hypothetical protein GUITHDRAFT_134529 [Guillardia theta CCMP2712]|eukprot:XP_005838618.1 hypothetical protein GUITHDRAFT_134529 [Guillardia theta CCMP2712]
MTQDKGSSAVEQGMLSLLRQFGWEIAKNTRWLVSLTAAAFLIWRRDAVTIAAIGGALGNAALGKLLKRLLAEKRPDGAPVSDPGMPSSHAMSLFFLSLYLSAAINVWTDWPMAARTIVTSSLLIFSTYSAAWRVRAGFHTPAQILVGSVLGGFNGMAWFYFNHQNMAALQRLDVFLKESSALPWALCGSLIVGALLVGSVERKISKFLKSKSENK